MSKSKTFRDVMLPMRAVKWIIGCGDIIEYPLGNPHEKISFLYSLAWVLNYYVLMYYTSFHYFTSSKESTESLELFLVKFFLFFGLFIVIETNFMAWKVGKEVKKIFRGIEKVDELLRMLKISDEYAKMYKKEMCFMPIKVTMMIAILTTAWYLQSLQSRVNIFIRKFALMLKFLYPNIIMFLQDLTFIYYTMCLNKKFVQLNETLQGMSETSYLYPQHMKVLNSKIYMNERESSKLGKQTNDDVEILKIAKNAHLALVKVSKHISRVFGFHLLISMIDSSVMIIGFSYAHSSSFSISSVFLLQLFCICLPYAIRIFTINHICEKTTNEARKTGLIICELHEPSSKQEFRSEIRAFTLQLIQNPLQFSSFGFATLNHSLILDLAGSITTYLVILIQL